jgi:hypothetical protein
MACLAAAGALALTAAPAGAAVTSAHGDTVHIAAPSTALHANQSSNWFGYNQGALEQGGKLFTAITGDWTVPTARQHTKGNDEYSSDWIGIGGGCVDAGCLVGDSTLIQTGTEQDVSAAGKASYSAWWEIIPGPSLTITNFNVSPGNRMHADIHELVGDANVWSITLTNLTTGQTYSTTVPYTSTHATAEWIEETPLIIGTGAGFAPLPNLTRTPFDNATTNGAPAGLQASEEMQLVDANNRVIGAPSAPDFDHDGFGACAWAASCGVPKS